MGINIQAIIQARMSSSRLPGKVLMDIAGRPMLAHVLERVRRASMVQGVMVATSTDRADDAIRDFCATNGAAVYRGSMADVLDRYYQAAVQARADVIVRITSDCPLIDPVLIDEVVQALFTDSVGVLRMPDSMTDLKFDFAANRLPPPWKRTYPIGLDTEVCTFSALERAWKEADQPYQREHVMPYLYEQKGRFRVRVLNHIPDYGSMRWTVDTVEDLEFVRHVFAQFPGRDDFSWLDVLELLQRNPTLAQINAKVAPKSVEEIDHRQNPTL